MPLAGTAGDAVFGALSPRPVTSVRPFPFLSPGLRRVVTGLRRGGRRPGGCAGAFYISLRPAVGAYAGKMCNFARTMDEVKDFVDALAAYVGAVLEAGDGMADYNVEAVCVVDARNHLFRTVCGLYPDEAEAVYPLRGLCRVDEETLELVPDRQRMAAVARDFFSPVASPFNTYPL